MIVIYLKVECWATYEGWQNRDGGRHVKYSRQLSAPNNPAKRPSSLEVGAPAAARGPEVFTRALLRQGF